MRRVMLLITCALAAVVTVAPASAQCPGGDGTLPGSSDSVTTVGSGDATPYTTIYLDDRDYPDLDEDGDAGGIWLYIESNEVAGLQRGGEHVSTHYIPDPPQVGPIPVLPPNPGGLPIFPNGLTLFPDGFGGGCWCYEIAPYDDCRTDESGTWWSGEPDSILF